MSSEYVKKLMALMNAQQAKNEKAFDASVQNANTSLNTPEDLLLVDRIVFAWKGMFDISQGRAPWRASGPLPGDVDWITKVYLNKKETNLDRRIQTLTWKSFCNTHSIFKIS